MEIASRIHGVLVQVFKKEKNHDELGSERPDPTPIAPPIGYKRQPSMVENIRQMIRSERLKEYAEKAGAETFEESEDFEVGDDYDPNSPYESEFDPPIQELLAAGREALDAKRKAAGEAVRSDVREPPKGTEPKAP